MTLKSATTYLFVLATVAVIGVIVIVCLGKTVPSELWLLLSGLTGGGLVATPSSSSSPAGVSTVSSVPAAPAPQPVPSVPVA